MGKRGNDNAQLSKEELEALESQESESAPTGSFAKASDAELKRRKIVKAATPVSSAASKPAASGLKNNPFASVSFADSGSAAPKVSFAPAPAAPKVSFAATGTPAPTMKTSHILKRTPAPESFKQHSTMNPASTFVGIPTPAKPTAAASKDGSMQELVTAFTSHIATLPIQGGEWTTVMRQFKAYYDSLMKSETASVGSVGTPSAQSAATLTPTSTIAATSPTITTTSAAVADTSTPTTDTKTTTPSGNDKKTKAFFQVEPAKHFLLRSGDGWVSTKAGKLSLESDATGKRIVIRNDAGNVNLNCKLPGKIQIVSQKNAKGAVKRFIEFITQPEGENDPLPIRLRTNDQCLDLLYEKIRALQEM